MHARPALPLLAVVCLTCLLLACAGQNATPGATPQKEVQFLDTSGFDRKLSASLAGTEPEVNVVFPANITLNNIPERMDKWLSKVEKYGGRVEIQAEPEAGRSIITEIFGLFVKAYEAIEEVFIYSPAKNYNVMIHYKARTGIVTRLAFVRKPEPGALVPADNATSATNATAPR